VHVIVAPERAVTKRDRPEVEAVALKRRPRHRADGAAGPASPYRGEDPTDQSDAWCGVGRHVSTPEATARAVKEPSNV